MSVLDPEGVMRTLEDRVSEKIQSFFPLKGKKHTLVITNMYPGQDVHVDDIHEQKRARLRGKTWAVGMYADLELHDNETGKVLDHVKGMKLLNLPKITRRYSYIVDGTEYQADNQWRLKSGVYARQKANGELETQFNLAKGRGFRMDFQPAKRRFLMSYGTTNVQLLPVLQALGVPDDTIRKAWGDQLYSTALAQKQRGQLVKLANAVDSRANVTNDTDAVPVIRAAFDQTQLSGETTKITLGKAYEKVDGDALLSAANKLLNISRGTEQVDNRDSLRFKELWSIENHLPERLQNSSRRIRLKMMNNLDRRDNVRSIVTNDVFNVPVKAFFTTTSLAQQTSQVNPIDMVGGFLRTTIMGSGGISNENAVSLDAKMIDSSYLGFVDPVHTPEGAKTGVAGHLSLGVSKRGTDPTIRVYDVKDRKYVEKTPSELAERNVAFADQYVFNKGEEPKPRFAQTTVIPPNGTDPVQVDHKEVGYIMQSPKSVFSMTANLVPFLASDQANRAGMATRHMEQAISLKNREEPLVQTVSGNPQERYGTWERILGNLNAHTSPISGKVEAITSDSIKIQGADKKSHTVELYDNFPLNDKKAFIHSTPTVKVGDTVEKGQIVADTNFTKNGTLSMGVNLKVGFLPFKGLVFEDGIVISETGSKKLTSEHLHKSRTYLDKEMYLGLKKFRANYPGVVSEENAKKLDEDGVVKKGETVKQGDVIMTVLQKAEPSSEQVMLRGIHKSLARPWKNKSVVWDKPYPGVVTEVVRNGKEVQAFIKTEEPADIGDKLSGRHGNKGVITAVLPDEEMPKNKDGEPLEIILNPAGVPGRINLGQVLETSLAKVADKQGSPYAVDNFQASDSKKIIKVKGHWRNVKHEGGEVTRTWVDPHEREVGYHQVVQQALQDAKVDETEELFDADTGKSLGKVLVGKQYIIKLMHQVDKKSTARSHGYGNDYDQNLQPKGGGMSGAQRFGELGLYAMLAHGAVHNLREAATYKGDKQQDEVWAALQAGEPLPAPKTSFAYEKFLAYLNAVGLNADKKGSEIMLNPFTDEQVLEQSNGELTDASKVVRGKDLKPEKGGLFDEQITGGPGGKKWSHIKLATSLPNPLFEKAILSLLGLKGADYDSVIDGDKGYTKDGQLVDADKADVIGPAAITEQLKRVNVEKELAAALEDVKTARKSDLDRANKKVKYLQALKRLGMSADKAYTLANIPVLPPIFRPVSAMEGGDLNIDGLNMLYRDVALINGKLADAEGVLPDEAVSALRKDLYGAVNALMGTGPGTLTGVGDEGVKPPGILTILSGRNTPKQSYFHEKLLDRAQDLSMRSVIVPDMNLDLDEVGLPRKGAMKIFRPFVVRELVRMGYTPLQAREEVEKKTSLANKALDVVVSRRPVLFKRDPVLHKFGIMAFRPKLHNELSIHIHPLVTGGFNADFDGDAMAVFVPVTQEAVDEAYRMLPSRNIFSPATGKVMYQPSNESQLGLYLLTQLGKETGKKYSSAKDLMADVSAGKASTNDVVDVEGHKTTAGRLMFYAALPEKARSPELLTDPKQVMGDKNLQKIMRVVASKTPSEFAETVDKIKNLGFGHAYNIGFSFDLKDFNTLSSIRDAAIKKADVEVMRIKHSNLSADEKEQKIIKTYTAATKEMSDEAKKVMGEKGNKLFAMHSAGVKPAWAQLQQMVLAPMLLENARGRVIPVPVRKSYAEGLDTAGYWVASSGARKGLVDRVLQTQEPGALSKQIINTVVPYVVTAPDCGTHQGLALDVDDNDLVDRYTAKETHLEKGGSIPAGTLITSNVLSTLKANKVSRVVVRSPLKCEAPKGLCSKCYGVMDGGHPVEIGTNIGAVAGQSIGERGTQLSMKTFHSGGLAGTAGGVMGGLSRVTEVLKIPEVLPNKATISHVNGTIDKIEKSPVGGWDIHAGGETHYVPSRRQLMVAEGDKVKKGQPLSSGAIDPRELLEQTNLDTVQRYIADEIHRVYAGEGIKRRNIEVVTKAVTNLGKVEDPGDSDQFVRGDYISLSHANALNRDRDHKNPIQVTPVLRGIETLPLDQSEDWLARLQYRKLKETYQRAATENWRSNIHGLHPVPAIAYGAEFGKGQGGEKGPY